VSWWIKIIFLNDLDKASKDIEQVYAIAHVRCAISRYISNLYCLDGTTASCNSNTGPSFRLQIARDLTDSMVKYLTSLVTAEIAPRIEDLRQMDNNAWRKGDLLESLKESCSQYDIFYFVLNFDRSYGDV
tara:strand:+ start:1109 stop:1498 length:390 start_codon:yes stop_codon:yes gene_type:complete